VQDRVNTLGNPGGTGTNLVWTESFSCLGNGIDIAFSVSQAADSVTGGGTWNRPSTTPSLPVTGGGAAGVYDIWKLEGATPTDQLAITFTRNSGNNWGAVGGDCVRVTSMVQAAFDTATVTSGNDTTSATDGATVTLGSITPGQANTILLGYVNQENHAVKSVNSPFNGVMPIAPEYDSTANGASGMFEDAGAGQMFQTDGAAKTFAIKIQMVTTGLHGLGNWVNLLSSWKASAAPATFLLSIPLTFIIV
jgi:hypothetical protein